MEILSQYNNNTLQLITDGPEYSLPNFWEYYVDTYFDLKDTWDSGVGEYWINQGVETKEDFGRIHWDLNGQAAGRGYPQIKLSIFSDDDVFLLSDRLNENVDFYISDGQLFLKPNESLDRARVSEGNYGIQYDFVTRFRENDFFYISEISPSRKEIRLNINPPGNTEGIDNDKKNHLEYFLNEGGGDYNFNSYLELGQGLLIPINGYAFDNITNNRRTLILKLNEPLSSNIQALNSSIRIVNKFLSSQTERIFFRDLERLAVSGLGLEIDEGYIVEDEYETDANYTNYNDLTGSYGENIFSQLKRARKDINLNVDYSKFSNHVFFGSAESKLKNFKDKAVKLEGLFTDISSSLEFSSSKNVIQKRKDLFQKVKDIEDNFTAYEHFLYNDGQSYSTASAPGIGTNLAGVDFDNKFDNSLTTLQNQDGFDRVYKKSKNGYIHLFTDVYNAEAPPFYNTNKAVYLSFVLRGGKGDNVSSYNLHMSGGHANENYDNMGTDHNYNYFNGRRIPYGAFSGSLMSNPSTSTSSYQRYIFKGEQLYWRPTETINGEIDLITDFKGWDSDGSGVYYEILSGSNVLSASISGSTANGYAYGIRDITGLHTPLLFPGISGSNNTTFMTASVLPQGDLFPIVSQQSGNKSAFFTDVVVSYNNPSDIHPFSKIYRPSSGSYAGSDKWNNWYDGIVTSASNYDNDNVHSLVNNLPLSLRSSGQHKTLRDFVNMLGEQYDLLRNYIDNYQNFYKMGYKNPKSIPDNLLPIIGDSIGFDLFNPYSGSVTNYLENNEVDGIGIQSAINSLWKKILNNVIYIYKTKGTQESLAALMNLYGFDADSFKLQEYGGSIEEHNPTVIDNKAEDLTEGLKNKSGNISFQSEVKPFPMLNLTSGSDFLSLDWWTNDAEPNGLEFVFNAQKSTKIQTLLRSSGSNDYWDLRIVPSGSSNAKGKVEFRLNYLKDASSAISTNHVSMSTDYVDNLMGGNLFNLFLQRANVTSSNTVPASHFTQSYHMYIGRKDDDKIRDVQFISMSTHNAVVSASRVSGSYINQNFITSSALTSQNLLMGETLSGSVAEVRAWSSYVSMSKFKQHILNYNSLVGGTATAGVSEVIYRYRLNENIPNWNRHPDSASLKIYDSNPQKIKDFSQLISGQRSLNYRTSLQEQTFYKFNVKGTDEIVNDNQTNIGAKLKTAGQLSSKTRTLTQPYEKGTPQRQISNKIGKSVSYVNALDSLIVNLMSDFKLDNYLHDGTMDGIYNDLVNLRKQLISDNEIKVDIVSNIKSVEGIFGSQLVKNIESLIPAKSKIDITYDIKNDILYRAKIKNAILQTQLNPNRPSASVSLTEPTLNFKANENYYNSTIDMTDDELTVSSLYNQNYKNSTIDVDDELSVTSVYNQNVKTNHSEPLDIIDLSNSKTESIYTVEPDITSIFLGSKNEFWKNHGKGDNQVHFIHSKNQGTDGNFNTYKYESRFTFPTIGDTEEFHPVSGTYKRRTGKNAKPPYNHHDNFRHFFNRQFIDTGSGYTYTSYFGVGSDRTGNAPKDGRMVGRTRYFSSSNGEIFYPSNHYIYARTSKDVLDNLIYKGTQNDGSFPTYDPIDEDVFPSSSAYIINVGGSDTLKKLKVIR